jgi:hypothetical protein
MTTERAKALRGMAWGAGLFVLISTAACGDPLDGPGPDASQPSVVEPGRDASPDLPGADLGRDVSPDVSPEVAHLDGAKDVANPDEPRPNSDDATMEVAIQKPLDAAVDRAPDFAIDRMADTSVDTTADGAWTLDATIDGGAGPRVVLRKASAWADCMPSVAADPIMVMWTVDISAAHGDTARVSKGTLTVVGAVTIVQDLIVDNPTIALVGGSGSADQRKPVPGTLPNAACTQVCPMVGSTKGTYRLDLVFDVDGQSIPVQASGDFQCAY